MKRGYKWALAGIAVVALGAATAVLYYGLQLASIGTAYTAKIVCSGIFVSRRAPESLRETDLSADDLSALRYVRAQVNHDAREVTATLFGLAQRKAVYREGRGCTVVHGKTEAPGVPRARPLSDRQVVVDELETTAKLPPEIDSARLRVALEWAFSEPDGALMKRTRAVVVVYKGRVVAERYADGFTKDTRLIGWSMTKSVINALIGVLVQQGKVSLNDTAPVPEWQRPGDPRREITIGHLLHMTSGLQFDEDYGDPLADVTYMLLGVPDAAAYAVAKPLEAAPGARWRYSSGTTNILAHAIRRIVGDSDYLEFPRRVLFDKIAMTGAVMEIDAAGTFMGSSFMYATARDWARFGLLYLRDGVWARQRILPEAWVAYTRTPAPDVSAQDYGAHFWLRVPTEYRCANDARPLPADTFHAIGHEGQFVTIIPSRELVLVRLGFTRYPCAWDHPAFVQLVLQGIADGKAAGAARRGTR